MLLTKLLHNKMELPSNLLEQIAFNTRLKKEQRMLIVMNMSVHEEYLAQPLQTNNKQFKIAVTFLSGYKGIFNVTNTNNKFYFMKSLTDEDGFIQITIPPGAYEIESLNDEIKRIIFDGTLHRIKLSIYNQTKLLNFTVYYRNVTTRTYNRFYV